ncbi:unnamed protein product [Darwinula stevensoni]|uniref:Tektin n=1 Tax=Darwinula stevensoni TaxID=69355 RepID=A0A7R9FNC5_9CRUS|nr:unnamed protein product [Darwinula stevensoni]CAG0896614.1 unnamed protein product [Darwinula stevensoni]
MMEWAVSLSGEAEDATKGFLEDLDTRIRECLETKFALEQEWGEKCQALDIDTRNIILSKDISLATFHPGAELLPQGMTDMEGWKQVTEENIRRSQMERMRCEALRSKMESHISHLSQRLSQFHSDILASLKDRIKDIQDASSRLKAQIGKIVDEMSNVEALRRGLRESRSETEESLNVSLSRLAESKRRPGQELCFDHPRKMLEQETKEAGRGLAKLDIRTEAGKKAWEALTVARAQLEADWVTKTRALHVEKHLALHVLHAFPSFSQLLGHVS